MKHTALISAVVILWISNTNVNAQGALAPPGAPAPSQKSLQQIWDEIQTVKSELAMISGQTAPSVPVLVTVQAGTLPESSALAGQTVGSFQIGKYEVTWDEWLEVRAWAVHNGYQDLRNKGVASARNHPVWNVSWFDVLKWCNARSERLGLIPVYEVNGSTYREGQNIPTINSSANGFRLPTEVEWEWAARGGANSQGYIYSGSNDVNAVAWYNANTSGTTEAVGTKLANELGVYDMSGNVFEWVWDGTDSYRRIRSGSWNSSPDGVAIADRDDYPAPNMRIIDVGFRVVRNY